MSKILVVGSLNLDYVIEVENMPKAGETIFGKSLKKVPGGKGANQAYAIGKLVSKILVVGSLNLDYVIEVENMPKAGETIFGKSLKKVPGGKGANQAYAIGKLGGDVAMIGAVGDDDAGQILLNNLKSVNVDTRGIEIIKENVTGQAYIYVDANGQNCITVISGANAVVDRDMINRNMELIDDAEYIVMQFEVPVDTVKYVKDIAVSKGKKVIIDPAPAIKNPNINLWKGCHIIKPNELELATLIGKELVAI